MVPECSDCIVICFLWKRAAIAIYGFDLLRSPADGKTVFMDTVPLLFYRVSKACDGRCPARRGRHEALYGRHLYRSASPRCACLCLFWYVWRHRHLVCVADRLDDSDRNVCIFLQAPELLTQWHPLHLLQSPPHCSNFPFFLSRTMLRTASPAAAANTAAVIKVPITVLLSAIRTL